MVLKFVGSYALIESLNIFENNKLPVQNKNLIEQLTGITVLSHSEKA